MYARTATLPDPDRDPARIDRVGADGILVTSHTGTLLADTAPHVIARLEDAPLRLWLDAYGVVNASIAHVRADWVSALQHILWLPMRRATLPEHIRWR